jgi:phosphoesterase RecJ-like protein
MNSNNTIHSDIIKIIKNSKNILIISHSNPDGDAIGSMLAFHYYAKSLQKSTTCLLVDELPKNLRFLEESEQIRKYNPNQHNSIIKKCDLILIVDLNDITRIRELEKPISESNAYKIVIDHHLDPKEFASLYHINSNASSTGELVWEILNSDQEYKFDKKTSEALYSAIVTDTGSFRFPKTSAQVHQIISHLITNGADPFEIYDKIYNQISFGSTKLLGLALSGLKLYEDGKVCLMRLSEDSFRQTNTSYKDTEFFVEKTLSIEGVQVGILVTEVMERSEIKISLRSKRDIPVNKIALALGGGGHLNAAGANIKNVSLDNAVDMVLRQLSKLQLK